MATPTATPFPQGLSFNPSLPFSDPNLGDFPGLSSSGASKASTGNIQPSIKKISDIKSTLLSPALTSHYQCWFNPPQPVRNWLNERGLNYDSNAEFFSLSCSEASLPGSSLITNEINDDRTGVTERFAYRRAYDDRADFTFYVDHNAIQSSSYNVIWFFENWISYVSNEQYALGLEQENFNYRFQFPDNYQSSALYINKFERNFAGQYLEYRFLKAYPIAINSMPVSYESSELLKCTVSFSYTRYLIQRKQLKMKSSEPKPKTTPEIPSSETNILGNTQEELNRLRGAAAAASLSRSRLGQRALQGNARSATANRIAGETFGRLTQ
jgi:hypothetical protein